MLRSLSRASVLRLHIIKRRWLSSSSVTHSHLPNAPLDMDPSLQALLKDTDMAILGHNLRHADSRQNAIRELELYPDESPETDDYLSAQELDSLENTGHNMDTRKSPAALFGSQRFGAIIIPFELQETITKLIAGSDKPVLRVDAKRLFLDDSNGRHHWDASYDVKYKSGRQAHAHSERDGTAFASVALPSHYAAIVAVLDHVKQRLGPTWSAQHIIDWGCGTGSGLWAAAHVFQNPVPIENSGEAADPQISKSTLESYVGIDKRDGLTSIGRRLLKDVKPGSMKVTWRRSFQEDETRSPEEGNGVIALSAFMLSTLQTPLARKNLVREMWESGADTIVLIDHSTTAGFECIAEARENLLRIGNKRIDEDDPDGLSVRGSHVLAPCPHDQACPLHHVGGNKLVCGFSQRLQRPEFVRRTKHSGKGHEDTGYSYVVIRKGTRPIASRDKVGRIGEVGRRDLEKTLHKERPMTELAVHDEARLGDNHPVSDDASLTSEAAPLQTDALVQADTEIVSHEVLQDALRSEAYSWPRLVFPPLKKSGHIILDGCTAEGKIMRLTIPKSQGKQPFYDARKSSWGDIFPHEPKNRPQERFAPSGAKRQDASKRSDTRRSEHKSYSRLADELKDRQIKRRQERKDPARLRDL